MENLRAMAYSRYTGFREITDRDVLELHCINKAIHALLMHGYATFNMRVPGL